MSNEFDILSYKDDQQILRDISIFENKLKKCKLVKKQKELQNNLFLLKKALQNIYALDPKKLQFRIDDLQKSLITERTNNQEAKVLANYLKYVVNKNIEKIQNQNISDLKNLINHESIDFDMILEKIKPKNYSYNKNYLKAIENWYELLDDEFEIITQNIPNFTLNAKEILQLKSGTQSDICILTCAIMHKLGDYNTKIYCAELDDFSTIYFIQTDYKKKTLIFDFFHSMKYNDFLGIYEQIYEKYKPNSKNIRKIKFSFNAFEYESE
jgi:hypothetical protein